jgi:hypothetical protein
MKLRGTCLFFASLVSAFGQQPNSLTAAEKAAGWILLFDGRTMNGWQDPSKANPPGDSWSIEDGALKSKRRPQLRQDLFTNATFGDFELAFEWRISERGNSGLKYRIQDRFFVEERHPDPALKRFEDATNFRMTHRLKAPPADGQEYVVGFEYQVIDNATFSGGRGPLQRAGSLYDMVAASQDAAKPAGEWNQARVVVKGAHVEHWLNGMKVVDTSLQSPEVRANIEKRWGAGKPVAQALANAKNEGPICLQNHNDEAWFRSIKVRKLK